MMAGRRTYGTGSVFKRKRSTFLYIRYYDATGKRRTESARTTSRTKAERLLRQRLDETDRGETSHPDRVTFDDLLDLLLHDREVNGRSMRTIRSKHLKAAFKGKRARHINGLTVKQYERDRLASGAARATVNNELAALRRMFNLAVEHGILLPTQAPKIRTPDPKNARHGFFDLDEFKAVLRELPEYLRPVMRFGYFTGWRVQSEVLPLQWRQIDFAAGTVRLEPNTTKNNEGCEFPFSTFPALLDLLEEQREVTREVERRHGMIVPWVFHNEGASIKSYRTAWTNACRRPAEAERGDGIREVVRPHLQGRLVHDLRRTAVRNLERAGVPRSVAMKLTGHKTESVYRRYAIVALADLREGVAKLSNLQASS